MPISSAFPTRSWCRRSICSAGCWRSCALRRPWPSWHQCASSSGYPKPSRLTSAGCSAAARSRLRRGNLAGAGHPISIYDRCGPAHLAASVLGRSEPCRVINGVAERQRGDHAHAGHAHESPCRIVGLRFIANALVEGRLSLLDLLVHREEAFDNGSQCVLLEQAAHMAAELSADCARE